MVGTANEHITKSRRTNDCNARKTYCLGLESASGSEGRVYFNIYYDRELGLDSELSRYIPDLVRGADEFRRRRTRTARPPKSRLTGRGRRQKSCSCRWWENMEKDARRSSAT